jgi:hypothetical protein
MEGRQSRHRRRHESGLLFRFQEDVLCDVYAAMANEDGSPKLENFGLDKLHLAKARYDNWTALLTPILKKLHGVD